MHFVDRASFVGVPTLILAKLHKEEQPKWLAYKTWQLTKALPAVIKPTSKWISDEVRNPLTLLFKNNCAYCGDYHDKDHDGEVDHFFPKELDITADYIYAWNNYVWACHSCNIKKRSHYPLINPCDKSETDELFFNSLDGRYLVRKNASSIIKAKFLLTEKKTFINGKKHPQKRELIYKQLNTIYLSSIHSSLLIYETEKIINPASNDTKTALLELEKAKNDLIHYLKTGDYVLLKIKIIEDYRVTTPTFIFKYTNFI